MSNLLVRVVATAICKSRTCEGIRCCQWPANMGMGLRTCPVPTGAYDEAARDAITAYEAFKDAERKASCKHWHKIGNGSLGSDGSSSMDWYCPDCHSSGSSKTPPLSQGTGS